MFVENTEELAQNKLILLYIIKSSGRTFTNTEMTEFVLEKNYMNYFYIQQYLSELITSEFIEKSILEGEEVYSILEKGDIALSYFKERIPNSFKEDLEREFALIEKKKKIDSEITADYFLNENKQYVVNLKLLENDITIFSLYLDVSTKDQAEAICKKWKENTDYIYQNVINVLISDKK